MSLNVALTFVRSQLQGFDVVQFELRDAISELFQLTLQVNSTDPAVDMSGVVGEEIIVALRDEPLLPQVQGIVRRARQLTSEPTGVSRYELAVVPPHWLTTRRRDHRIFQNRSVPEIVADVLAGYGQRIPAPAALLSGAHPKREYTVQYGETDHDFMFRLLADEGLASFFDHSNQSAWTLIDDTTLRAPPILPPGVPFVPPSSLTPQSTSHVTNVEITSDIETSALTLRDFDYEKPGFTLQSVERPAATKTGTAQQSGNFFTDEDDLEAYEFAVGNFRLQTEGDARAKQLLQERRATRRLLSCETSFALGAGTRMTLFNHPRADVGGALLVLRATTFSRSQATGSTTRHVLDCVDAAAQPFRPPRRAKPRVHGSQTALVVGASGQEIDVDALGRVEIEFKWDRRDLHTSGTSRRVRVSQGWAGPGSGFVMLPRVGDEVIVTYLDGDPDEPVVVGRVHNALTTTPLNLPKEQTQSVWRSRSSPGGAGFNEILMEDAAGNELLSMRAERDFHSDTMRNSVIKVGGGQSISVGGGQSIGVGGGQNVKIGGPSRSESGGVVLSSVGPHGTIAISADSDITIDTKADRHDTTAGSYFCVSSSTYLNAKSVVQVVAPNFHVFATEIRLEAGGSVIRLSADGIKITSSAPIDINGAPINLNC